MSDRLDVAFAAAGIAPSSVHPLCGAGPVAPGSRPPGSTFDTRAKSRQPARKAGEISGAIVFCPIHGPGNRLPSTGVDRDAAHGSGRQRLRMCGSTEGGVETPDLAHRRWSRHFRHGPRRFETNSGDGGTDPGNLWADQGCGVPTSYWPNFLRRTRRSRGTVRRAVSFPREIRFNGQFASSVAGGDSAGGRSHGQLRTRRTPCRPNEGGRDRSIRSIGAPRPSDLHDATRNRGDRIVAGEVDATGTDLEVRQILTFLRRLCSGRFRAGRLGLSRSGASGQI